MIAWLIEREGRSAKAAQLHVLNEAITNLEDIAGRSGARVSDPDCWISRGKSGNWTRCHNQLRLSLFISYRVPRGPPTNVQLSSIRRTRGTFVSGEEFCVEDQLTGSSTAHRFLKDAWVGVTEFVEANVKVR